MNSHIKHILFLLIVSFVSCVVYVTPYFIDSPIRNTFDLLTICVFWCAIFVGNTLLLAMISSYKISFAILFPCYTIMGGILSYFKIAFNATLTPMLIDASLNNDWGTSIELISLKGCIFIVIIIAITICTIVFRYKINVARQYLWLFGSFACFLVFFNSSFRIQRGLSQRFPFIVYDTFARYLRNYKHSDTRINPDTRISAETKNDSLTIVFVLGESLRSDHLSLNGYSRPTTPLLSSLPNVISLPNIYSEYTYTNRSIPHIMTRADSSNIDFAFTETSFIPSMTLEGFSSLWISNQDIAETFAPFIAECDSSIFVNPDKSVFGFSNWYDFDILPVFNNRLKQKNAREFIVIHTIGNHWYYNNHYPDSLAIFRPITQSREIHSNTPEEIINSYDNAILATDRLLYEIIKALCNKNALLIFLSDHGEALGENDMWLHASEDESIRNPACIVWYSDEYLKHNSTKIEALRQNADKRFRTDFLYHSILYSADNQSEIIDTSLSIFKKTKN